MLKCFPIFALNFYTCVIVDEGAAQVFHQVEHRLTTTLLIRPPRCCCCSPEKKLSQIISYLKNSFNTTTQLIRPTFHGPKVVALTGFHCTSILLQMLQSDWLSYSYTISHYSSPINFLRLLLV